jgi:hypothetical protein
MEFTEPSVIPLYPLRLPRMLKSGGWDNNGAFSMCDYSLHNVKSRPAKVGDKLTTRHFYTGTTGFAAPENPNVAVCLLPGTELSFASKVSCQSKWYSFLNVSTIHHTTAIFRQINEDKPHTHHDALEFPDGQIVLLTRLLEGQEAIVLQLPAQATSATKVKAQEPLTLLS